MGDHTDSALVAPDVEVEEGQRRRRRRKRKVRRRKVTSKKEKISIVLSNCKGFTSKAESIKQDIVAVSYTHLTLPTKRIV